MPDLSKLSDRELDARCAESRGWKWVHCLPICTEFWQDLTLTPKGDNDAMLLSPADAAKYKPEYISEARPFRYRENSRIPRYSSDANDTRELEAEIERGGEVRILLYNTALSDAVNAEEDGIHPAVGLFRMVNASPRKRAEAFVVAMGGADAA